MKLKVMKLERSEWLLIVFNLIVISLFSAYYIRMQNYEFLWYVGIFLFFFMAVLFSSRKIKFDYIVLWGLSIWGLLHMAGGSLIVNGDVLYNLHLLNIIDGGGEFFILKFDQFVHFYGFGVATLVGYALLKPNLDKIHSKKTVYIITILIGMGFGALNEVLEFIAIILFPSANVGGYVNNALDLVFNMLGSIGAVGFLELKERLRKKKKSK